MTATAEPTPARPFNALYSDDPRPDGVGLWRAEVTVFGDRTWSGNALRFVSEADAAAYVRDLSLRWYSVEATRVVPDSTPLRQQREE